MSLSESAPALRDDAQFNLKALIVDVLENTYEANPGLLADKIIDGIPTAYLKDALGQCLPAMIRLVNREQAHQAVVKMRKEPDAKEPSSSVRWQKAAEHQQQGLIQYLSHRVYVREGLWKHRGACTIEDVQSIAEWKGAQAERLKRNAQHETRLAELMKAEGVEIVEQLPEDKLLDLLAEL